MASNDKRNFQWVTMATLDLIKLPLKDILASRIKPADLYQEVQSCSSLKLRPDERKLIEPPDPPDYSTFDVTLLYKLIRNLCGLPRPAQGWGKEPKVTDTQISDDIERLRLFRNNYYAHANSASISDGEFEDVWRNLKLVIKRFNSKISCSVDYEEELIRIECSKYTDDHLKTCRILLDAFANIENQTDSKDEPDISIKGENEKNYGETALFEAYVEKVKSSSWTITWHKRRGDVIKCIDTSMERYSGSTKRKLVIKSLCKEDEGEYQAVLSLESNGPDYRSKNIIRLFVSGEVPCVKILVDSSVCFGSTTTIKSEVSSTPIPKKIEWQKSKDRIDFHCTEKTIYLRSTDILTSPPYVIPKTTFTDKLYYRLVVWNEIGKGVSNTVYLNVTGSPPNITTNLETNIKNRSVKMIGSIYFYDDSPGILETFWTKNEKKIDPEKSGGKLSEISNDTPSLTIRNVSPDDAGEYRLTAINAVGSTTSDVIVLGIPSVFLEKIEDKKNGGQRITVMIKSLPAPFHVQWSAKSKDDENFTPIDINTEEYEGTTVSFPHPVLVVRHRVQLEKNCFKIEVTNFIGNTVQEISGENNPVVLSSTDNAEETPYNDHGASVRFTRLNNILADQFPPEKVEKLKFLLKTSKKVKNQKSVFEAKSAMDCLRILQDEHLFTQKDVIFMQFLCRETDCLKLYAKCIEYAEKQKALCFFEKQSVNGYVDVQFHVQGDLSDYSKEFIQQVIETVAAILDCEEEDIQLNALRYSTSFFLSLSIKKVYIRKLLALKEQDRLNLKKLNIDFLKIDKETIHLNRGEDYIEKRKTMDICNIATTVRANMLFFWSFFNQLPTILGSIVGCFIGWNLFYLGKIPVMNIVVMVIAIGLAILLIWYLGDFIWINIKNILFPLVVFLFCACAFLLSVLVFGEAVLIFFLVTLKKTLVNFDKMLHITSEEILTLISSVWIAIIAGTIVLCVFYWGKTLSHLQMNGKPKPFNVTHNSFEVRWNRPTFAFPSRYIVYVRNVTAPEVREYTTRGRECSMKVIDLSFNTKFVVSVRACIGILKWPIGDESDVITTKHLAFKMKSRSTLLQITQATPNSLPIYAVEYNVEKIDVEKIRRIMIGEAPNGGPNQNGKGILIFSTPHSGKTTLLQGIMNFIFGVSSTDNFRLCFAPELSNTSDLYQDWVTVYEFQEHEGGNLGYPLTIIDIPRIHGSKRKYIQTLHEQMNFLVNSYRTKIDCICFVAQANTSSFSSDQMKHIQLIKYLFETDSDMSCFFTFADLGPPHIKHILEVNNIAFNESFSVNCSCLFQTNEKSSDLFWKTNYDAFDKFFNHLQVSVSKSLRKNLHGPGDLSIPENRKELTSNIAVLYPEVRKDLAKLGDIKNQLKKFSNHKDEIMSTGDFSFTIEEITQTKKPLEPGMHVTNCMHCFCTCHNNCAFENNDDKHQCIAMKDGYCTVCTDRCIWYFHENTPHIYIYDSVKVTKSYREMKSSYEAEKGKPLDYNEYLEHLNKDIEALLVRLHDKVTRMNKSGNELNGIPKSPLAGSFDATIDKMIAAEIQGKEMGFQQRIEMFQELKKYADFIRISHPTDSNNVIYHI